jgi:dipeptidyl aminopeptidase/acylaminoacyl peptidase
MSSRWLVLGVWLTALPLAAQQEVSIDALLSIPYPTRIVAAERADRVVWVSNEAGVRDVWTAAGPELLPVRLTSYTEDDGQTLGGLTVTPDGSVAVFVHGGGRNRAGEHPNPTSNPEGVSQSVWAVATSGGEAWELGEGSSPVVSPDGSEVIFSRAGVLYRVELGSAPPAEAVEAKPLFEARGQSRGAAWAPQGDRIAFVSDRGDHSFIGIYDLEAREILWVAPSVDRDAFPAWSPDGRQLAFIRRDGALKDEIFNFLISWSFRLMVADAGDGSATEVWRSPETGGGFAQIYPARPLRWAGKDRLVFFSEHSGWMHIYSMLAAGGEPVDLTPGECEAEDSAVDPSGEWLAFSHNCDEIDRRQISRTPVAGGTLQRLTPEGGIFSAPTFADSGRRMYLRAADARQPTRVAALGTHGITLVSPMTSSVGDRLVVPEQAIFEAADGVTVHGQLFVPHGASPEGEHPAVVFMHGGPMRQMLLGWHYREYYSRCYAFNQYLASRGWVVLSVNYRAGIGYGQGFRLADRQGPYGASEYQDIVAAGRFLQQRPEVDGERVALWGGSYGGYLTAMGLARDSDLFAAGVDLHGVHDWSFRATDFTEGGGWGIQGEEAMELALQSSPSVDVSQWSSPVLLVHGDDDRNVLFQQTTDLVQRLRRQGLEPELLVLPDEVHGFLRHDSWLRVFTAAAEFLDRTLGTASRPE